MDADAYGITSDQLTFGWIAGDLAGKTLTAAGLPNGAYRLEWWNCQTGTVLSNTTVTVADGTLAATIPAPPAPVAIPSSGTTNGQAVESTNSAPSATPPPAPTDLAFKITKT